MYKRTKTWQNKNIFPNVYFIKYFALSSGSCKAALMLPWMQLYTLRRILRQPNATIFPEFWPTWITCRRVMAILYPRLRRHEDNQIRSQARSYKCHTFSSSLCWLQSPCPQYREQTFNVFFKFREDQVVSWEIIINVRYKIPSKLSRK